MFAACGSKEVPHAGENPLYSLSGAHKGLPCEDCHGPLTGCNSPQKLPTQCISCHQQDTPVDATHSAAIGQDCISCHDTTSWTDQSTTAPPEETGSPPDTDTDTDTQTDPTDPFVHPDVDPNEVCWDCHESVRPENHHDNPEKWDCGPCHDQVDFYDSNHIEHPVRTPHGEKAHGLEQPASAWVVACDGCHPSSPPAYVCSDCHEAIFPHTAYGGPATGGAAADQTCLGCHPIGEK